MSRKRKRKRFTTGKTHYIKHGMNGHPLFPTYLGVMSRCYNKKSPGYKRYGKRGIRMQKNWIGNPKKFIEYIMSLPGFSLELNERHLKRKMSLDRKNNDGDYRRGNLRWATAKEQFWNSTSSNFLKFDKSAS